MKARIMTLVILVALGIAVMLFTMVIGNANAEPTPQDAGTQCISNNYKIQHCNG